MSVGVLALLVTFLVPVLLIFWNKRRIKGRILCYIVRKDKSVISRLCELRSDFVIFEDRAYDLYPDMVRITRFPGGWPPILQELVPCVLYDEEDAIPLDWINIDNRLERSMNLRSALDENWVRKLVKEAASEGAGFRFNWRKVFPIAMLVIGGVGLVFLLLMNFI